MYIRIHLENNHRKIERNSHSPNDDIIHARLSQLQKKKLIFIRIYIRMDNRHFNAINKWNSR